MTDQTGRMEDIQMKLQLSVCLSASNLCEQNSFPGVILFLCNTTVILTRLVFKLKDLKVHKFTDYPYLYGQSSKTTKS